MSSIIAQLREDTKTMIQKWIPSMYRDQPNKLDLSERFLPLLGSDTHGMVLSIGHALEKWYQQWYCGSQLHHVGAPYEQCRDGSKGISVFLARDVNVNCKARLSVLPGIPYEFDPIMYHFHTVLVPFCTVICIVSYLFKLIQLKFSTLSCLV